jgi:hypothetical protein
VECWINFLDSKLTSLLCKLQPSIKHSTALICVKIHLVITQKNSNIYYKSEFHTGWINTNLSSAVTVNCWFRILIWKWNEHVSVCWLSAQNIPGLIPLLFDIHCSIYSARNFWSHHDSSKTPQIQNISIVIQLLHFYNRNWNVKGND